MEPSIALRSALASTATWRHVPLNSRRPGHANTDQPLTASQREHYMKKGLCFRCGCSGHRASNLKYHPMSRGSSPTRERTRNRFDHLVVEESRVRGRRRGRCFTCSEVGHRMDNKKFHPIKANSTTGGRSRSTNGQREIKANSTTGGRTYSTTGGRKYNTREALVRKAQKPSDEENRATSSIASMRKTTIEENFDEEKANGKTMPNQNDWKRERIQNRRWNMGHRKRF
ncbi:hypothetical protein DFH29DRAFT_881655 [Suillus ampliporus]|nr:hypothetical protein DFH29DRAFT_881655 [Suillus ampliporus]